MRARVFLLHSSVCMLGFFANTTGMTAWLVTCLLSRLCLYHVLTRLLFVLLRLAV